MSMEEETRDTNWNTNLSQSYTEGIERLLRTNKNTVTTFEVPQQVLEERKRFWNGLFNKYSEELSDEIELELETLKPKKHTEENHDSLIRVPMRKSPSVVQYWVNTGNLPYSTLLAQKTYSDSGSSLSEMDLSQSQNLPNGQQGLCENTENKGGASNFSCSSVDTAAYILSNANITKKAKTMAIVEGARYPQCVDNESADTENADIIMHPATDSILSNDKANLQNNNDNNYNPCFTTAPVGNSVKSTVQNTFSTPIAKKVYTVPDYDITFKSNQKCKTELIENETDIDSSQYKSNISVLKQFVVKTSKTVLQDKDSASWTEYDAKVNEVDNELNDDLNDAEDLSAEEKSSIMDSDKKLLHRKKLYSGRDSPVDLIHTKRSSINRIGKPKKSLHPALDPTMTINRKQSLLRRRQLHAKKRRKWSQLVSQKLASMNNNDHESHDESQISFVSNEPDGNTHCPESPKDAGGNALLQSEDKNLADLGDDVNGEESSSVTSSNILVTETTSVEKQNDTKSDGNNVTDDSQTRLHQNLQPVVNLIRLSDQLINKYISQSKKSPHKLKNVIIPLTRISPSEIKNYTSSTSVVIDRNDSAPLENTIRFKNKNITNIQLQRRSLRFDNSKQRHSKTDGRKHLISCQIQETDLDDVDSDQSTVFLCECKYGATHEKCSINESSSFTNNSSQDVMYSLTEANNCNNSPLHTSHRSISTESTESNVAFKEQLLRSDRSKRNLRSENKAGLKNTEIIERIKKLKPIVLLERLSQEQLRNARIRRNTENFLTYKRKTRSQDISFKNAVAPNKNRVKSLRVTANEQNKVSHTDTHSYNRLQFDKRKHSSPIKRHMSEMIEVKRKTNHTRHHSVAVISSDEETEFVKFIRNVQNNKRPRLQSNPEGNSSIVTRGNIIDTSEEESDIILVKADATKKKSTNNELVRRRSSRHLALQNVESENDTTLKKKSTETLERVMYDTSSSDASNSIYTSTRKNTNRISFSSTKAMKSADIMTDNKSLDTTPRTLRKQNSTPKKNGNTSPKASSNESLKRFKSTKGTAEKNIKTPVTSLHFRTRIFESDTESMSMSSNPSEIY